MSFFSKILLIGGLLYSITVAQSPVTITEPGEIVNILIKRFDSYKNMTADIKEYFRGRVRRGKLKFMKPNYFRVDYYKNSKERSQSIIINDKKVFIYFKNINIVCEQNITDSGDLGIGAANLENLRDNYNFNFSESTSQVKVLNSEDAKNLNIFSEDIPQAWHFKLTPKDITQDLPTLEIWVDDRGFILRSKTWTLEGKLIDIYYENIKTDEALGKKTFFFEPPPSARVIKNNIFDVESDTP